MGRWDCGALRGRYVHAEDDTYEFDMPLAEAQATETCDPGKCPKCGAPIQMHLKRWLQVQ